MTLEDEKRAGDAMTPQDSTPQTYRTVADDGPPDPDEHPWVLADLTMTSGHRYPEPKWTQREVTPQSEWKPADRWVPWTPPVAPAPTPRWTVNERTAPPHAYVAIRRDGEPVTLGEVVDALNAADQATPPADPRMDDPELVALLAEEQAMVDALSAEETGSDDPTPPADDECECGGHLPGDGPSPDCPQHGRPPADDGVVTVDGGRYRLGRKYLEQPVFGGWGYVRYPEITADDLAHIAAVADALGLGWRKPNDLALNALADDVRVRTIDKHGDRWIPTARVARIERESGWIRWWRVDVADPAEGEAS